ncbi:Salicylate hydroxylase [Lachnellula cervina]|uniref:Salicylate hydroxylase n=1 Tax=Lachnellula cervina TaxID=1316786 RepID=A0A7D8Z3J9_9HELO|nr:Salicylate hydroxylase [Lachnellula cervina]
MTLKNLNSGARLRVAIIGGGPAGLGAAIEFATLPFVDWNLYEQASEIREIGAGISVQPTTWRLLEHLGAAENLKSNDFYRAADGHSVQHRNGRTGELLVSHPQKDIPKAHLHARTHRAKLQLALLKEVEQSHVRLSSRLVSVNQKASGKLVIKFQSGFEDEVDLLVGADGVRSVVRNFAFPDHRVGYTGKTSYRTIVSTEEIAKVNGVPDAVTFWHGPSSWLYTCPLGNGQFEVTTMTSEPDLQYEKVSWGQDATVEENAKHFKDFSPIVRAVVATPKEVKKYALFAGPRLDNVIARGSIALVGDASHRAGAGFALEDVFVLIQSIKWAHENSLTLADGLGLFNRVRGPHYKNLYGVLDEFVQTDAELRQSNLGFDDAVNVLVEKKWSKKFDWISAYDVGYYLLRFNEHI